MSLAAATATERDKKMDAQKYQIVLFRLRGTREQSADAIRLIESGDLTRLALNRSARFASSLSPFYDLILSGLLSGRRRARACLCGILFLQRSAARSRFDFATAHNNKSELLETRAGEPSARLVCGAGDGGSAGAAELESGRWPF